MSMMARGSAKVVFACVYNCTFMIIVVKNTTNVVILTFSLTTHIVCVFLNAIVVATNVITMIFTNFNTSIATVILTIFICFYHCKSFASFCFFIPNMIGIMIICSTITIAIKIISYKKLSKCFFVNENVQKCSRNAVVIIQ